LTTYPEHPFPYYSQYNPYVPYIESSMLQSSISIEEVPSLLRAIDASVPLLSGQSRLVLHESIYIWALNHLGPDARDKMVPVGPLGGPGYASFPIPFDTRKALEDGALDEHSKGFVVYTIWWSNGKGWYNLPVLPANFRLIHDEVTFSVYVFEPLDTGGP
jgi:hypothetical protein